LAKSANHVGDGVSQALGGQVFINARFQGRGRIDYGNPASLRAVTKLQGLAKPGLKVVLADRGSAPTLVFDEIDTGVGGAVADAIGMRLAKLGRGVQVLAVTHAPQVAARADRHYLITKDTLEKGKRVATRVTELASERRREEIARMLAGAEITNEARAAAERLIKAAS
jgi:hypothetical protein